MSQINFQSQKKTEETKNFQVSNLFQQNSLFKDFFESKTPESSIQQEEQNSQIIKYNLFQNDQSLDEFMKLSKKSVVNAKKKESDFNINNSLIFSERQNQSSLQSNKKQIEIPNLLTTGQYYQKSQKSSIFDEMTSKNLDDSINEQFKKNLDKHMGLSRKQIKLNPIGVSFKSQQKVNISPFKFEESKLDDLFDDKDFSTDRIKLKIKVQIQKTKEYEIIVHQNTNCKQLKDYVLSKKLKLSEKLVELISPNLYVFYDSVIISDNDKLIEKEIKSNSTLRFEPNKQCLKKLQLIRKEMNDYHPMLDGFNTFPPVQDLQKMSYNELQRVKNFRIISEFIIVRYLSETDITFLDFSQIVKFEQNDVDIYPDENNKPNVGQKLNKPAQIEYLKPPKHYWNKFANKDIDHKWVKEQLQKTLKKRDSKLISYDENTGNWTIEVPHFTKYGNQMLIEDDESESEAASSTEQSQIIENQVQQKKDVQDVIEDAYKQFQAQEKQQKFSLNIDENIQKLNQKRNRKLNYGCRMAWNQTGYIVAQPQQINYQPIKIYDNLSIQQQKEYGQTNIKKFIQTIFKYSQDDQQIYKIINDYLSNKDGQNIDDQILEFIKILNGENQMDMLKKWVQKQNQSEFQSQFEEIVLEFDVENRVKKLNQMDLKKLGLLMSGVVQNKKKMEMQMRYWKSKKLNQQSFYKVLAGDLSDIQNQKEWLKKLAVQLFYSDCENLQEIYQQLKDTNSEYQQILGLFLNQENLQNCNPIQQINYLPLYLLTLTSPQNSNSQRIIMNCVNQLLMLNLPSQAIQLVQHSQLELKQVIIDQILNNNINKLNDFEQHFGQNFYSIKALKKYNNFQLQESLEFFQKSNNIFNYSKAFLMNYLSPKTLENEIFVKEHLNLLNKYKLQIPFWGKTGRIVKKFIKIENLGLDNDEKMKYYQKVLDLCQNQKMTKLIEFVIESCLEKVNEIEMQEIQNNGFQFSQKMIDEKINEIIQN